MEDWVTIKNLKRKHPTISNRKIAKELGISHNTVKAALERKDIPVYKRKPGKSSALEPFREVIFEMVNVKKLKCRGPLKPARQGHQNLPPILFYFRKFKDSYFNSQFRFYQN
jgi:hypothetical protein